jgi:4-amino-4-deoxy-L-arabinose transferase-like glycosyltransferase
VFFYPKVILVGLLPWTPLLIGRLWMPRAAFELARPSGLLWSWAIAVVGFFTFSGFKLDHYVFPAAPALCLYLRRRGARLAPKQQHQSHRRRSGRDSARLFAAGVVLIPGLDRVPLDLPAERGFLPIVLLATGLAMLGQIGRHWRPLQLLTSR